MYFANNFFKDGKEYLIKIKNNTPVEKANSYERNLCAKMR